MKRVRWATALAVATVTLLAGCGTGRNSSSAGSKYPDQGITDTTIKIGLSEPETGSLAAIATYGYGMKAYFDSVNASGGVDGRQLSLVIYDDAYDPAKALANIRRANEVDKVFAVTGIGIPQNNVRDYATREKLPQVFIGTADSTFSTNYPWSRAWYPDIAWQGYLDAQFALQKDPAAKIGIIALDNDLSTDLANGVKKGLGTAHASQLVKVVNYNAANPDVSAQLLQLKNAGVTAVVSNLAGLQGVSAPKYLTQINLHPMWFIGASNSSYTSILQPAGLSNVKGYYSPLYLKDPTDPRWTDDPGMKTYRAVLAKYASNVKANDATASAGSLAGDAFVAALKAMKTPTRQGLMDAVDHMSKVPNDGIVAGATLNGGADGRLIHDFQMSQFDGTQWQPAGDITNILQTDYDK